MKVHYVYIADQFVPSTMIVASEAINKQHKMAIGQVSHQLSKFWSLLCEFTQNSLVADITVDNLEWTPFEEPIEIPESDIRIQ